MAKTLTARFASHCRGCNGPIAPGETIAFIPGVGSFHPGHEDQRAEAPLSGVASASQPRRARRYQSNLTRFSSGAEVYTNRRGRCEDAPCCGCCS